MKRLIISLGVVAVFVFIGVAGYQYMFSFAADKVMEKVQEELLTEEYVTKLKEEPIVLELAEQARTEGLHTVDKKALPFSTKEEGLKVVMSKFSIGELKDLAFEAKDGLTETKQRELYETYKDRFTEEEWQALLIIGLEELESTGGLP